MQEKAKVIEIRADSVAVIPLEIDACVGCSNAECKDNGHEFLVTNPLGLPIKVGSEVRIGAGLKKQLVQAFMSIGIPVLLSIVVFALTPRFIEGAGEGLQVGLSLLTLLAGGILMYRITKLSAKDHPEILELINPLIMEEDEFDISGYAPEGYDPEASYAKKK